MYVVDHQHCPAWLTLYLGPVLLGYVSETDGIDTLRSWRDLPRHKDEDQVGLDVNRSFIYYPQSMTVQNLDIMIPTDLMIDESEKKLDIRKQELSSVITQVLREHPMLCYFQGFHDIVQVFLLVLGLEQAPNAVAHLSLLRIRDFMLPSLSASLAHLNLLPSILHAEDAKLCQHLSQTQPFFALAATLTLYAHDIQEYGDIARLFDFLIAQPAVVPIYFFAVIVLSRREELFDIPADEPEMLHSVLSKLPKPLNLEQLISRTMILFNDHPPEKLPKRAWARISCHSVLKTTYGSKRDQPLKDGEALFELQTLELRRAEELKALQLRRAELRKKALIRIWEYRRPFCGLGLAVFVGIVSLWLGKRGLDSAPTFGVKRVWEILSFLHQK